MVSRSSLRQRSAFTLIELLVVIAIIAILMALLLPAVQKVREAANRAKCGSHQRQIAIALHAYHHDHKSFPHGSILLGPCCGSNHWTNWAIEILPYIEEDPLYKRYQQGPVINETAVGTPNDFVRQRIVKIYMCPSDLETEKIDRPDSGNGSNLPYRRGSYRAVSGKGSESGRGFWDTCEPGFWDLANNPGNPIPRSPNPRYRGVLHGHIPRGFPPNNSDCQTMRHGPERLDDIKDGTSNTLMIGEYTNMDVPRRRTFWAYTYTSYNQSSVTAQSRILNNSYLKCRWPGPTGVLGGPGDDNPCKRGFGSMHTNGLNFCLADSSVRFVSYRVDINALANMATIAGDEFQTLNDL